MPAQPSDNSPWPQQTPAVAVQPHASNRRSNVRKIDNGSKQQRAHVSRQTIADPAAVDNAEYQCENDSGNDVLTCYPTADTIVPQSEWSTIVWNSRHPDFTQTNLVNLYLFRADSQTQILSFHNLINSQNSAGSKTALVNDTWWGDNGVDWTPDSGNITYPFYWIITRNDATLDGTETTQPTFHAVQTTYADSVIASMSASSVSSASSASVASASAASASLTRASASAAATGTSGSTSTDGGLQSGGSDGGFPHWAIAVIVVLGFLAIATSCILAFFIIRRIRRRNELESNRNSMGSSSPMMAHVGNSPGSPLLATGAIAGVGATTDRHSSLGHSGAGDHVSPDGASTISRTGSAGDTGPFSGADAAIMANAFRQALRKPDFANRPVEEGDSPGNPDDGKEELINRELAEEGRDIRSVSSSRGVRVETLSDSGDTVQDNPH